MTWIKHLKSLPPGLNQANSNIPVHKGTIPVHTGTKSYVPLACTVIYHATSSMKRVYLCIHYQGFVSLAHNRLRSTLRLWLFSTPRLVRSCASWYVLRKRISRMYFFLSFIRHTVCTVISVMYAGASLSFPSVDSGLGSSNSWDY
jgi:hypothetical protein